MAIAETVIAFMGGAGALGVGSLLGDYVGRSDKRREAHTELITALQAHSTNILVESDSGDTYSQACLSLDVAMIKAGVPRYLAADYLSLARAVHGSVENTNHPDSDVMGLLMDARNRLLASTYSPRALRPAHRVCMRWSRNAVKNVTSDQGLHELSAVPWARRRFTAPSWRKIDQTWIKPRGFRLRRSLAFLR